MPVKSNREYRACVPMECRKSDQEGAKSYIVEGYATTFNDPYVLFEDEGIQYWEEVDAKAFDGSDMSDVIFQYNHAGMVYARQKNGSMKLETDDHGLKVTADLGATTESRQMFEAIEAGLIDEMSFAFTVDNEAYDSKAHKRSILHIKKVYDVSAVSEPANDHTAIGISARGKFEGYIEQERQELARAQRLELKKRQILLTMEG